MENIDEDIKIVEELIKKMKKNNFIIQYKDLYISDGIIKDLENLLSRLKTAEKETEISDQLIERQELEIDYLKKYLKEAERMNDVLAEHIDNYTYKGGNSSYDMDYGCDFQLQTKCICDTSKECTECIKEWARKKVEDEL